MAAPYAILHITAATGGGTDRYVRDLAAQTGGRHWIWHANAGIDIVEDAAGGRFGVLPDQPALERLLHESGIGLVHLHGVTRECTERLDRVRRAQALPYLVSLHDLTFVAPDAFGADGMPVPDAAWIATMQHRLREAAGVIAPSGFIRDMVTTHFGAIAVTLIEPGVRTVPPRRVSVPSLASNERGSRHVVAVVGAIGPHKGSALLGEIAVQLARIGTVLVVIGYTDTRITQGWHLPSELFVHGPYEDEALPGLFAAYGVDCVLFPNRLPESFSYTLSEAWASGLPVVVPDVGALGERVARHGGGWRLSPGFGAPEVVQLLTRVFSAESMEEWARVKSQVASGASGRVPTLDAMARDFDVLYERLARPHAGAGGDSDALAPLVAANLDGFAFRRELVVLATELARTKEMLAEAVPWRSRLEHEIAEARAWARKLELDVATLKANVTETVEENRRLADIRDAFDVLPVIARKALLKLAFRGRR